MKQRITGRVNGGHYEVVGTNGAVMKQIPLAEARADTKVQAAIKRNGWEAIPE